MNKISLEGVGEVSIMNQSHKEVHYSIDSEYIKVYLIKVIPPRGVFSLMHQEKCSHYHGLHGTGKLELRIGQGMIEKVLIKPSGREEAGLVSGVDYLER